MKKKDLLTLWDETKNFLSTYTTADIQSPRFIKLKSYPTFDRKKIDANLQEPISISERPDLEPVWSIANENLEKAINGLNNVQHFLPLQPNAIDLEIWYDFRYVDTINSLDYPIKNIMLT